MYGCSCWDCFTNTSKSNVQFRSLSHNTSNPAWPVSHSKGKGQESHGGWMTIVQPKSLEKNVSWCQFIHKKSKWITKVLIFVNVLWEIASNHWYPSNYKSTRLYDYQNKILWIREARSRNYVILILEIDVS